MKKARTLLGIDIGTSGLKVSLFDQAGNLLTGAYRQSLPMESGLPAGQTEQIAENWWDNLCSALSELFAKPDISSDGITAIGICGFHHVPVFIKENGQPSRPVMLLHDSRLPESRKELEQAGIIGKIEKLTKSMISAGHFPPIFHYIAEHDSAAMSQTRWIFMAKDYLRFKLTGQIGTEICDATGLNLIEPKQTKWSEKLCKILSVPIEKLPDISNSTDIAGKVTDEAASETGLKVGTPVVYGGGDSHCALLGLGCIKNGDTGLLLGTNSTLRAVFDDMVWHKEIKVWTQRHVVPGHYTISASSMAGASVLSWFRQNFCQQYKNNEDFQALEDIAGRIPIGSEGLVFVPYIYGERCPFYNPDSAGAFLGIKHWHKTDHFLRSIFDGVAVNIANCYNLLEDCAASHNSEIKQLRLGGGGSKTTIWHQIISDCLNKPILIMNTNEAGTLGAALLAGIGIGVYSNAAQAVDAAVRTEQVIEPNENNHKIYLELQKKLNDLYRRIEVNG